MNPFDTAKLPQYVPFGGSTQTGEIRIELVTTTPILGGGVETRKVDDVDPVRVPSIRGQLRFWWRALFAGNNSSVDDLYRQERELWGGLGGRKKRTTSPQAAPEDVVEPAVASKVSLAATIDRLTDIDTSDISLQQPDAYALWTARRTRDVDAASRRRPGTRFTLVVTPHSSTTREQLEALRATLRAWLLFGGVGGRTRRGCGSLALATSEGRAEWLPPNMQEDTLRIWFHGASRPFKHVPSLHDARYQTGATADADAVRAWHTAIGWLRQFRQGVGPARDVTDAGDFARQLPSLGGGNAGRPGRTRWPEPDKIRHRIGPRAFDHAPLSGHGSTPFWPRAGFGLPIEIRFQTQDRQKQPFNPRPPRDVQFGWTDRPSSGGRDPEAISRLASPLIVKPVQLRDGGFVPLALWFSRSLPDTAMAGVYRDKDPSARARVRHLDRSSLAPFGITPPPGDTHAFLPLTGKGSLRDAFMDWVAAHPGVTGGRL